MRLDLGIAALRRYFVSVIVVGCLILTVIGILTSVLGSRTRLSSYMLARIDFGTQGSTLLNLAFAVSLLGWFGININLFGDALARMAGALWGYAGPVWPVELVAGLLMFTPLVGLRAITALAVVIVPILGIVCLVMLRKSLEVGSLSDILARARTIHLCSMASKRSGIGEEKGRWSSRKKRWAHCAARAPGS